MISRARAKQLRLLHQKKHREQERSILVEGVRLCEELPGSMYATEEVLFREPLAENPRVHQLLDRFREQNTPCTPITDSTAEQLAATSTTQGFFAHCRTPCFDVRHFSPQTNSLYIYLFRASDPGNVGTIIRTAAWFGVEAVFLSRDSVEVHNPKVVRGSMGAIFRMPVYENADLEWLVGKIGRAGGGAFVAEADADMPLGKIEFSDPALLVFGQEAGGFEGLHVSPAWQRYAIPCSGYGESLNLGVAVGITLHHATMAATEAKDRNRNT